MTDTTHITTDADLDAAAQRVIRASELEAEILRRADKPAARKRRRRFLIWATINALIAWFLGYCVYEYSISPDAITDNAYLSSSDSFSLAAIVAAIWFGGAMIVAFFVSVFASLVRSFGMLTAIAIMFVIWFINHH